MKVRLNLNIGNIDAKRLELSETQEGKVLNVGPEVGDELLRRNWATREDSAPATGSSGPGAKPSIAPSNVSADEKKK
jgi:hypothetical protein